MTQGAIQDSFLPFLLQKYYVIMSRVLIAEFLDGRVFVGSPPSFHARIVLSCKNDRGSIIKDSCLHFTTYY